ncbi:MAG: epoxyqueuosine reductase [Chloroflexi bacterium]|nr:epoxyqueuosine reductase [Chloroflexota bacterium]
MEQLKRSNASIAVQDSLPKLEVDLVGVVALSDAKGSRVEKAALKLLPAARSVVVVALGVFREVLDHARPERTTGSASLNDMLDRHLEYLSGRVTKAAYDIARTSHRNGLKALPLPAVGCPIDARFIMSVFSYKHAGQAAGLGYIGRSSLLITPNHGPRVRLACCLTEAVLEPTAAAEPGMCEGCDICIENCPSKALSVPQPGEPYAINKFACSAFRNAAGGCAECMRLCPAVR